MSNDWLHEDKEQIVEGVTFYVKYLGSCIVEKEGPDSCAEGVQQIVDMVRTIYLRF